MKPKRSSIFDCLTAPVQKMVISPTSISWRKKHKMNRVKRHRQRKDKGKKIHQPKEPIVLKSYKLYIKSDYWKKRREKYLKTFGKKCVICGADKPINVHHLYYANYSNEKDEHLVTLCNPHHELFHSMYKTKKDMILETNAFIIEQSELNDFPVFGENS